MFYRKYGNYKFQTRRCLVWLFVVQKDFGNNFTDEHEPPSLVLIGFISTVLLSMDDGTKSNRKKTNVLFVMLLFITTFVDGSKTTQLFELEILKNTFKKRILIMITMQKRQ